MKDFKWVPAPGALEVSRVNFPASIPILRPPETSRFLRWKEILSWYGPHSIRRSRRLPGHLIAVLDEELAPAASILAAIDDRPLIQSSDILEITSRAHKRDVRSLLIFAWPSQLKNCALLKLSASLSLPWGMISGQDLAAVSFAVAKLLASRHRSRLPRWHLDAIAQQKWCWPKSSAAAPHAGALHNQNVLEVLQSSDWDSISIHCHGDGAHANFNSVVLCGVPHQLETGAEGWQGGCSLQNGSWRCKRVHRPEKRPFRFGDLRARRICLFTCNGYSVAGDVYPSDASFILSAVEGYSAAVLTTDRRLPFEPWLFRAVPSLLAQQDSLGRLATILNDLNLQTEGARPYLLYGDPADIDPEWHHPNPGKKSFVSVSALGDMAASRVVGIAEQRSDLIFRRGASIALFVNGNKPGDRKLIDRTDDLARHKSWLVSLGRRVQRARRIESAIRHYHRASLGKDLVIADVLAELATILARIEESVDEGGRLVAEVEQNGVWAAEIETWRSHSVLLTSLWDNQFAVFLDEFLLESDLQNILRDGFFQVSRSESSHCPRCRCTLIKVIADAPLLANSRHQWLDCPTCGPREARDVSMPRLSATIPRSAIPGQTIPVLVKWSPPFKSPLDDLGFGFLVTHLKDSGRGQVSYRNIARVEAEAHSLNMTFLPDSALEIHTIRFALVRDLNVSYLRLRIPCVASAC